MQKAIELKVNNKILRGMYHRPEKGDGFPAVIMFHGFTGDKLGSHRSFLKLSRLLTGKGMVAVRFDFSGSGESDGDFEEMTFSGEVAEAEAILNYTRNLPDVDPNRLGIVGHSMGGAVAAILAGLRCNEIKALVLWAAAGVDLMKGLLQTKIEGGELFHDDRGCYDLGGLWLNGEFGNDLEKWDAYRTIKEFTGEALIIHGSNDETVPVETAHQYQEALAGHCRLQIIEGADHSFNRWDWEREVLEKTVDFLNEQL